MNILNIFLQNFIIFAASGDLGVSKSFQPVLTALISLSSAAAVLSTAICIFRYMTADDPQAIASAKNDIKTVWIAYICLNSIGLIMNFVIGLISSSNF